MARNEFDIVTQRPESSGDRVYQRRMVSAREIRAAYRTGEKYITYQREPSGFVKENDMARGVPRAMAYLERGAAELYRVTILQPSIWFERLGFAETEGGRALGQLLDPETILALRPLDGHACAPAQFCRTRTMVDMAMGEKDLLERRAGAFQSIEDPFEVTSRINDGGLVCSLVNQDGAILLERSDGNDRNFNLGAFHGSNYRQAGTLREHTDLARIGEPFARKHR